MQSESVSQWLDPAHVRSLAEGLLVPNSQSNGLPNDQMFGSSFEGYAEPAGRDGAAFQMPRHSLSDAQSRAASSGILRGREQTTSPALTPEAPAERSEVKLAQPFETNKVQEATGSKELTGQMAPVRKEVISEPASPALPAAPAQKVEHGTEASVESSISQERSEEISADSPEDASAQIEPARGTKPPKIERLQVGSALKSDPLLEAQPTVIDSPFKIASPLPKQGLAPSQAKSSVAERPVFRPLPLSTRLQAFGVWLKEQIPTRSYFICDRHGEIVVDEVGSEKLIKVARTLAHASSSAGRQVGEDKNLGSLHVKIGPDRVMEVVPRHSHFGLVVLGVIVQRPLSRDAVASVSRALGTALAEPSAPRQ